MRGLNDHAAATDASWPELAIQRSLQTADGRQIDWLVSDAPVDHEAAVAAMDRRVSLIRQGEAPEAVWLLEHRPVYTAGTAAREEDLLEPQRFPVIRTGRGGQYTYHGPGQRVVYVMVDLQARGGDVRTYVGVLEAWIIAALFQFGIVGERRSGRTGVWVTLGAGTDAKIAAIGVRIRRWVTLHGLSINVYPNLDHYSGIVPCGLAGYTVTSLRDLGVDADLPAIDDALSATMTETLGCLGQTAIEKPHRGS